MLPSKLSRVLFPDSKVVHTNQCLGGYVRTYVRTTTMDVCQTNCSDYECGGDPKFEMFPKR